jgi:hypothetical protein
MQNAPQPGEFVRVRSRRWLVEDGQSVEGLSALRLACIDDDAQGESVAVLWDAELDAELIDEGWAAVSRVGTDDPSVFSAYLRTLRWNTGPLRTVTFFRRRSGPASIRTPISFSPCERRCAYPV